MRSRTRSARRLKLERLEDRAVPATLYVATTGSDSNTGASDNPWLTLQHAANQVGPGDTVVGGPGITSASTRWTAADRSFSVEAGASITTRTARTDGINLKEPITSPRGLSRSTHRRRHPFRINTGVIIQNNPTEQSGDLHRLQREHPDPEQ